MATASEPWRPGAPARPGGAAKGPASAINAAALVARLRELAASSELPLDALEQSLRAVVAASGAGAGAICLYDTRQEMLRLAAEHGLSDEGCRRLRTVRRGDAASWDMPLHGLLNRRAYLIDSAARNRYVPPLVEDSSTVRTIACLPLFQGNAAQGSLVLVMVGRSALREDDIRALDQPLRELARLIDTVRRQVSGEAVRSREIAGGGPAPATPGADAAEASTVDTPAPEQEDGGRIAALTVALTAARREKASLEADLDRLRTQSARQDPRIAELTAEVDRLHTHLAEAEAGAAYEHRAREELEAALQRDTDATLHELQAVREAARHAEAAHTQIASDNARMQAELDWARHEIEHIEPLRAAVAEAERERARLEAALEQARAERETQSSAARERRTHEVPGPEVEGAVALDDHIRAAHEHAAAVEASRDSAMLELTVARASLSRAEATLRAAQEDASRAHDELDRLRADEVALHGERDAVARELAAAHAREQQLGAQLAERAREAEGLRQERAAEAARVEQAAVEADRLRQEIFQLEMERSRLGAEVQGAAAARAQLEEAFRQGRTEARAAEVVTVERSAGGPESGEPTNAEVQAALAALGTGPAPPVRSPAPESRTTPAAPPAPAATPKAATTPATGSRDTATTVVLEADPRWEKSAGPRRKIVCVAIDDDTQRRVADVKPSCVVANLTHPKALSTLIALRAAGSRATFWGCMAEAAADRGLMLGIVEPAARPLDPNAVLAHLEQYGTRGRRVLTIGDDVDAFISLRQALTRSGMSVSMAWNGKQAVDLMPMVRPHLVVLDLAVAAADAAPVLALLAASTPSPFTLLVPGTKDATPAFARALEGAGAPAALSQLLARLTEPAMG